MKRLKAWLHWKKQEKDLSEDDKLFIQDIEQLLAERNAYREVGIDLILDTVDSDYVDLPDGGTKITRTRRAKCEEYVDAEARKIAGEGKGNG